MLFRPGPHASDMATRKTGDFFLTETITIPPATPSGARVQGSIDLGAYVNVPTGQAVAITRVDFIYQHSADFGSDVSNFLQGNGAVGVQLSDLNPGTAFVRADDQSLIASGSLNIDDTNNIASHVSDLYPDNYGPASLSEAFMVVNDSLYLVAGVDGAASNAVESSYVTARITCSVVKLQQRDWVAIAIQSTASDN